MKLFAALGPGDIVAVQRARINGEAFLSETSITYSEQLFDYCCERGIETLGLSHNKRVDYLRVGLIQLENCPRVFKGRGSVSYHLSMIARSAYLARRARRFGADLAIVDASSAHCFALAFFALLKIPVVVDFHNTRWPNGFEPTRWPERLIRLLDAWFFRWVAAGTIGVSPECGRQLRQLAGPALPFFEYRAQFRREDFRAAQSNAHRDPFRVVFAGRAERNKGVLDIAAMADRLRARSRVPIQFEVCGDGGALPELRRIVEEKGLLEIVHLHGQLAKPELIEIYARAHAVLVPTRSNFCEGLPKVCAEGVLSGLPIVTSRLSNALPVLGPAVAEAEPDNIESYVEAILELAEDRTTYKRLSSACPELARQFLDRSQSYPAAIDRLIAHLFPNWKQLSNYEPLFGRVG
jgi:glycogen(starch) synthase